jgi:hypothetical protein
LPGSSLLEIKAVEAILTIHEAQLFDLPASRRYRIGLLMNFNALRLKDGLRRFVM